jgi:hypothetical protein
MPRSSSLERLFSLFNRINYTNLIINTYSHVNPIAGPCGSLISFTKSRAVGRTLGGLSHPLFEIRT